MFKHVSRHHPFLHCVSAQAPLSSTFCRLVRALSPPRTMDPHVPYQDDVYIGYSICCDNASAFKRVRKVLSRNNNSRANAMTCTEFSDFIFLKPQRLMGKDAFDSWRKRQQVQDLRVCMHQEGATAVEGLSATMKLASKRLSCMHFLPSEVGWGYGR